MMKNKLLTSLIVLGGLAVFSPSAAHAQAYPYCILGWNENTLYAAPGGPVVGVAPAGSAIQVTQTGPANWAYIQGYWGSGWVAANFIEAGCAAPVNCCAPPPPVVPCCAPPPVTRHRERHVYDQSQHHEYETESGGYAAPYSNGNGNGYHGNGGNGYHGNGNGHDKGEYQDNNGYNGNGHNGNGQDQAPVPEQQNGNGNGNNY